MELHERLGDYEVTAVPPRLPSLSLVWAEAPTSDDEPAAPAPDPVLAILDDYRITRIPGRAAS